MDDTTRSRMFRGFYSPSRDDSANIAIANEQRAARIRSYRPTSRRINVIGVEPWSVAGALPSSREEGEVWIAALKERREVLLARFPSGASHQILAQQPLTFIKGRLKEIGQWMHDNPRRAAAVPVGGSDLALLAAAKQVVEQLVDSVNALGLDGTSLLSVEQRGVLVSIRQRLKQGER